MAKVKKGLQLSAGGGQLTEKRMAPRSGYAGGGGDGLLPAEPGAPRAGAACDGARAATPGTATHHGPRRRSDVLTVAGVSFRRETAETKCGQPNSTEKRETRGKENVSRLHSHLA